MSGRRVLGSVLALNNLSRNFQSSVSTKCLKQPRRNVCTTNANLCGKFVTHPSDLVSQEQADELIRRLRKEEINLLKTAIEHFESHADKEDFEGQLAATRWRSRFGRPTKVTSLGDVDPTGTYCKVPEDWMQRKFASSTPKPTNRQLLQLSVVNGLPFIGFGFLDNFIMILCGDWLETKLNSYMCISTMAAAGLGNTISDVFGIQTAVYVERFTEHLGFKAPPLTQFQFDMKSSKRAANVGRILGITIGCLIGMSPLLFMDGSKKKEDAGGAEGNATEGSAANVVVN